MTVYAVSDLHLDERGEARLFADDRQGQKLAELCARIRARIEHSCVRRLGEKTVVLQHGHELDDGNEHPGGSGEVMTNALHQAVIPWLRHKGAPPNLRMDPDRIVALRPEEAVITDIREGALRGDPATLR